MRLSIAKLGDIAKHKKKNASIWRTTEVKQMRKPTSAASFNVFRLIGILVRYSKSYFAFDCSSIQNEHRTTECRILHIRLQILRVAF